MKSFSILRTNVGLTTNIKVMVGSDYGLNLESIDSNERLSSTKFKKVKFNKNNYYDELIPYFFKEFPSDLAFDIKYDDDNSTMIDSFYKQYDEMYQYGARNIINNKNYTEEYEYFAPLYIKPNSLPKKFIIFRVDGAGIETLSRNNFKLNILDKFKTVKVFDLEKSSVLGEWLELNFKNNKYFPVTPLEIDFRNLEFCKWNGIDYERGGYITRSLFIDDILDEEKEIFELEKFVFDSYKNNKLIFPNIINFSFLFDDTPSTPDVTKKWSLNRYFGFYIDDMELVKTISPYITPFLKDDVVVLDGNILYSSSSQDPFVEGYYDNRPFYVEYNGEYYLVEKFAESSGVSLQQVGQDSFVSEQYTEVYQIKYRIISDIDLSGKEADLNKNYGVINTENTLVDYDSQNIVIDNFDSADVWLIEVDGIYHNLVKDNGAIKLSTDYSFVFNENNYTYKVAGNEFKVNFVVDFNNPPKKFKIYRLKFTDIKDFDDKVVDTEYSKYEYEKESELTLTDETKMYFQNLLTNSNPKDLDDFIYNDEVVNIPVSSEYTANFETFKIENDDLTTLWRKNAVHCRWGYQNSLSANDVPYLLNNSLIFEDFNRTVNPFDPNPKRIERNLDYFYTINSSTSSYIHHSLHIEDFSDVNFGFDIDKYLNQGTYSYDYFTAFFERKSEFNSSKIKKNLKKYSEFNPGDASIPNITLFRGIEFRLYEVESVNLNTSNEVENINLKTSNQFEDYKFSILLSDNSSDNDMSWVTIESWQMDKEYEMGSIVNHEDILYIANSFIDVDIAKRPIVNLNTKELKTAPYNVSNWDYYSPTGSSVFWSPEKAINIFTSYSVGDYVYNNGEYYHFNDINGEDFWNPIIAGTTSGYDYGDIVLFKGEYYMSLTASNNFSPDYIRPWYQLINSDRVFTKFWEKTTEPTSPKWKPIEIWNPSVSYNPNTLIVHNETVYLSPTGSTIEAGEEPGISSFWTREYSLQPDTNFVYSNTNNPIIEMNNRYYLCDSNTSNSTLENGINVYINKKWKNVLVNIAINDNTFPNLRNVDRDILYNELYSKLTAYNFIQCVNDISNKYGFSDYINYVVISESGDISNYKYDSNIKNLPYLLKCELPDELKVKLNSLEYKYVETPSELISTKVLNNSKIKDITYLNWYNNVPMAYSIVDNKFPPKVFENLHGNKNYEFDLIYRFSGYYMPIFYDIQIFQKNFEWSLPGNYKFDTSLTDFGLMKERKMRKVNSKGSLLKLKDLTNYKSIYPMLDEFGYSFEDFFIFRSTWDTQYHTEIVNPKEESPETLDISELNTSVPLNEIGQPLQAIQSQNYNL